MTIDRQFSKGVVVSEDPFSWSRLEKVTEWLTERLDYDLSLTVEDTDGQIHASSVSDARDHVEASRSTVRSVFAAFGLSLLGPPVSATVSWHYGPARLEVDFSGTDQTRVQGLAAGLTEAMGRGVFDPDEILEVVDAPSPRSKLRAARDHPWVVGIGSSLIAALLIIVIRIVA